MSTNLNYCKEQVIDRFGKVKRYFCISPPTTRLVAIIDLILFASCVSSLSRCFIHLETRNNHWPIMYLIKRVRSNLTMAFCYCEYATKIASKMLSIQHQKTQNTLKKKTRDHEIFGKENLPNNSIQGKTDE